MSILKRILKGHRQAFLMSLVVILCYFPVTIGLSVFKLITFETPIHAIAALGVMVLLAALVCPLLVAPCARAFGLTFANDPDATKAGQNS